MFKIVHTSVIIFILFCHTADPKKDFFPPIACHCVFWILLSRSDSPTPLFYRNLSSCLPCDENLYSTLPGTLDKGSSRGGEVGPAHGRGPSLTTTTGLAYGVFQVHYLI